MKRLLLALVIAVPLLLVASVMIRPPLSQLCDAPYPEWTGDPCGDDWTNPALLDYVWPPSHWFAKESGGLQGPVNR